MTKPITHLLDNEFNPVCRTTNKNIDGTHKRDLVTCNKCNYIGPVRVIDISQLNKDINRIVAKAMAKNQ